MMAKGLPVWDLVPRLIFSAPSLVERQSNSKRSLIWQHSRFHHVVVGENTHVMDVHDRRRQAAASRRVFTRVCVEESFTEPSSIASVAV
jgi:hypothetical protein